MIFLVSVPSFCTETRSPCLQSKRRDFSHPKEDATSCKPRDPVDVAVAVPNVDRSLSIVAAANSSHPYYELHIAMSDIPAQKHDCLWFSDGNVVLASGSLLFRVHKGVLALHSTVFRDMFDLPIVSTGDNDDAGDPSTLGVISPDLYDGLPMVLLSGDKGEDVAHLLRTVYERECVVESYFFHYSRKANIGAEKLLRS